MAYESKKRPPRASISTAPKKPKGRRQYAGAKAGRLMFNAPTSSADSELYTSLDSLRNRSRALVRDNVFAKRARTVTVNNVIGQGIGLQGAVKQQRGGRLAKAINDEIEIAWKRWARAENCHTGGTLHFSDIERLGMGETFEAGEILLRLHFSRFGRSQVPLALEIIESERLADDYQITPPPGAAVTQGIEHDPVFHRPTAYYIHSRHPSTYRQTSGPNTSEILRVPADQIIHLRLVDRWPQTRGVPALHAAISRLNQLGEFEEAALVAARIGASKVGFFEAGEFVDQDVTDETEETGTLKTNVEAGEFTQLPPGYSFNSWDPTYPNETFDPFLRASLRGLAAGIGVSYESLSRDYSQSNYSSSRLSLLEDRDLWRVLQSWWIRSLRERLHAIWLQQAVLAGAIPSIDVAAYIANPERFEAAKFKPRGWGWVDPTKEVAAYKEAERAGYATKADIIAATAGGLDLEDIIDGRRLELDMLEEAGLRTDTTDAAEDVERSEPPAQADTDTDTDTENDTEAAARMYAVRGHHAKT